jgi:hypothetical protein
MAKLGRFKWEEDKADVAAAPKVLFLSLALSLTLSLSRALSLSLSIYLSRALSRSLSLSLSLSRSLSRSFAWEAEKGDVAAAPKVLFCLLHGAALSRSKVDGFVPRTQGVNLRIVRQPE